MGCTAIEREEAPDIDRPTEITLNGASPLIVEAGSTFQDPGATAKQYFEIVATQRVSRNLTSTIKTESDVDTSTPGEYTVTYSVLNDLDMLKQKTRTVKVVDTTAPVITLIGNSSVTVEAGSIYDDLGATASDIVDGDLTASITSVSNVDTSTPGEYTVTYNVSDAAGNIAELQRNVIVEDTTAPVIALIGDSTVTVEAGTTYIDAGATATDNIDGNLTASITTVNNVDISTPGEYTVTYNVKDYYGNPAEEMTRTVKVVDTTAPVITLIGNSTVETGSIYNDLGANAFDIVDGDLTASIITVSNVNTSIPGQYTVTYNVSDAAGNTAEEMIRTVIVLEDTTAPMITLIGDSTVTVEARTTYIDAGATATDNVDGNLTASIITESDVDTSTPGQYTVTYNVSDAAGNEAVEMKRIVIVEDTKAPIITLTGDSIIRIKAGSIYNDQGATAFDNIDGNLTARISTVSNVDTSVPGEYTVTYNVSDDAGNAAKEVIRTVIVEDTTVPVIILTGDSIIGVEAGTPYEDEGATAFDNVDGDITNNIIIVNNVDTSIPGQYTVTYNVSDTAGNAAEEVTRTVYVQDTTVPVITLKGLSTVRVEAGTPYEDEGATASDNIDGNITNNIVTTNNVVTFATGTYYVTYNVRDANGNAAEEVTRTVIVEDTTAPVITLTGHSTVEVGLGSIYDDKGATAYDIVDGDLTANITTVSNVNTSTPGTYYVTYNVSDAAGNAAAEVTRTVRVI